MNEEITVFPAVYRELASSVLVYGDHSHRNTHPDGTVSQRRQIERLPKSKIEFEPEETVKGLAKPGCVAAVHAPLWLLRQRGLA